MTTKEKSAPQKPVHTVVYVEQTGEKGSHVLHCWDSGSSHSRTRASLLQINFSIFSSENILSVILQPACRMAEGPMGICTDSVPLQPPFIFFAELGRVGCGDVIITQAKEMGVWPRPALSIQWFLSWSETLRPSPHCVSLTAGPTGIHLRDCQGFPG